MNKELSKYRYEMAVEKLNAAKSLKENGFYKDSISRSYYSIFSSARALLALIDTDSAKHSGIISLFNRHFVKTNLISKNCSKIIANAQIYRQRSDYGDFMVTTKQEAEEQIKNAQIFLKEIKTYLDSVL